MSPRCAAQLTAALLIQAACLSAHAASASGTIGSTRSVDGKKYYEAFLDYRQALSNRSVNSSSYFSAKLNEIWIGYLLEARPAAEMPDTLRAIRNRYRFGDEVKEVYAYSARRVKTGQVSLILIYENAVDRRVETLQITYVVEGGSEKIASLLFDSSAPKNFRGGPPIARFGY